MSSSEPSSLSLLSLNNKVFAWYLINSCILALKMFGVTFLTAYYRIKYKVLITPEDKKLNSQGEVTTNEYVERVRRAHLNDLENIPIFWMVGLAYVFVEPNLTLAIIMYTLFMVARVFHTLIYTVIPIPQPARSICFFIGVIISIYMAFHSIICAICNLCKSQTK